MATKTITGTGAITSADFKACKWVGKTKGGNAVTIALDQAINMGNIDWTFAEKADVVQEITMTAVYDNTDTASDDTTEPWSIEIDGTPTGADSIVLGAGIFYIGTTAIGLTRGGGKFTVEREYREINADGDRGPVAGRIAMEGSRATLTMNVLEILTSMDKLYSSIDVDTTP